MHFAVQHSSQAAATAAAERLVQRHRKPWWAWVVTDCRHPEFCRSGDGTSPLDAINPPQLGTVNGSVFSGDGVTGIAGASVTFRNASLIYGRNAAITTDGIGNFVFNNVPVDSFSLQATYNNFQSFKSPVVIGAFAPGTTVATQNVVFTNDGVVRGTVRRDGFPIGGGFVQVFDSQFFNFFGTYNIAADGSYLIPILVPGNYQIRASDPVPQGGTELFGIAGAAVTAGQTTSADRAIQPTGTISGTVFTGGGAPAAGIQVNLNGV